MKNLQENREFKNDFILQLMLVNKLNNKEFWCTFVHMLISLSIEPFNRFINIVELEYLEACFKYFFLIVDAIKLK